MTDDRAGRKAPAAQDFWAALRLTTQSRIGLGPAGDSLPTRHVLELKAAHASARDAVHDPLDVDAFAEKVAAVGIGRPVVVTSRAATRNEYLKRPDLGRLPADLSAFETAGVETGGFETGGFETGGVETGGVETGGVETGGVETAGQDIGFVLADGLSPRALVDHGVGLLEALVAELRTRYSLAPPVIATQARVALGDTLRRRWA